MESYESYKCKVVNRTEYKGRKLREGALLLNGITDTFDVLWKMAENDPYPGEWAMSPQNKKIKERFLSCGILWIASGDLEFSNDKAES